jgi:hypothetical protein
LAKKTTDQSGANAIYNTGLSDRKSSLVRLSGIKTVRHKQGTNLKSFIRLAGIPKQKPIIPRKRLSNLYGRGKQAGTNPHKNI